MDKIGLFNLQDFLDNDPQYSALGAKVVDMSESGLPVARTAKGDQIELNPAEILTSKGQDPTKFDFEINTPDSAIEKSPVGIIDRLKLTTSTPVRSLPYLKTKFEDAMVHPDKGVLVKQNGAWAQVDPDYLGTGTAWDKTKEFAKDVVDVADEIAAGFTENVAAGSAAAVASVAGPVASYVASIPAAGAGNLVANKARFRLGKMLGTYAATDEEQIQDEVFEMTAAAAGQAAAPFIGSIARGTVKGLGWMAAGIKALPQGIVQMQAKLLGTEATNLYRVAERPAQVETAVKTAWNIARSKSAQASSGAAQQVAQELQQKEVMTALTEAVDELPKRYVSAIKDTVREAGEDFSVNVGQTAKSMLDQLADRETPFLARQILTAPGRPPRVVYRPLTETEAATRNGRTFFDQKAFNKFVQRLQGWSNEGELVGEEAVQKLAQIKKSINEVLRYPAEAAKNNPAELQKIAEVGNVVDSQLDGVFGAPGTALRTAWESKGADYRRFSDAVSWGRQLMNDTTGRGLETFTKQLAATTPGRGMAAKKMFGAGMVDDQAGSLVELLGEQGVMRLDKIKDLEAARVLIPAAPRLNLVNAIAGPAILTGPMSTAGKVAAAAPLLAQSSPALVRKEAAAIGRASQAFKRSAPARALGEFTDFMKGVSKAKGPQFLSQMLQDQRFQNAIIQSMTKNFLLAQNTSAMAKQLVEQKMGGKK